MPTRFTGSSWPPVVADADGDDWVTAAGDRITSFSFDSYSASYTVNGNVSNSVTNQIPLIDGINEDLGFNSDNTVVVGATGVISGHLLLDGSTGTELYPGWSTHSVTNHGSIGESHNGSTQYSFAMYGGDLTFVNSGTVYGRTTLRNDYQDASITLPVGNLIGPYRIYFNNTGLMTDGTYGGGVGLIGEDTVFINSGTIRYSDSGVGTNNGMLDNSGIIEATFSAVSMQGVANNSGQISGSYDVVTLNSITEDSALFNSGLISSHQNAVYYANAPGRTSNIFNQSGGIIETDMSATGYGHSITGFAGTANITNHGTLMGHVSLAEGDDVYKGQLGSLVGRMYSGDGSDRLFGGAGDEWFSADGGDDLVHAGSGDDVVNGMAGQDRLFGAPGGDAIDGGAEGDVIFGGRGNDTILGGLGDDTLSGERGSDVVTGGGGADVFRFGAFAGFDTVTDFEDGIDLISVVPFRLSDPALLTAAISEAGADAVVDWGVIGGYGVLTITGAAGQIDSGDFLV